MKSKDQFIVPREPLKDILEKEVKDQIEVVGIKTYKRFLRIGYNILGRIKSIAPMNWTIKRNPKKEEYDTISFLQVAVIKKGFINTLISLFGKGIKYFLIDTAYIKSDYENTTQDDIIIEENAQYWNAEGIGIFSKTGRKLIEALAWKKAHFKGLEEFANYIPKQTYFEVRQAKQTEKARMLTELEKERWASRTERAIEEGSE